MSRAGTRYWDGVAAEWQRRRPHGLWRKHCDAVGAALIERWLPPGRVGSVLKTDLFDEAFSDGLYPTLAARAARVVGVDLSPVVQRAARERHEGLETLVADVRRLPFADGSFDASVSTSTLDHFESREGIAVSLRELHRVLRPGGRLLLTLDNGAHPAVWLRNALPLSWLTRLGLVPYCVGATCGPRRLRRYVREAGLEVQETTAVLHCPRAVAVAAAGWLGRRRGGRHPRFLRWLAAFERLERWPTRFRTGHFVAVLAVRPET